VIAWPGFDTMRKEDRDPLANFSGTARLFPLPNVVLFPQAIQPLHIFEPRYRSLTADALADDRCITLVLLQAGWETDYAGTPEICSVACLGQIVAEQRLPDGRYNLLLRGLSRVRIEREMPQVKAYRSAEVHLLEDVAIAKKNVRAELRGRLRRLLNAWLAGQKEARDQFRKLFRSDLALGALCDIVAFALPLEVAIKQQLLEELDVQRRVRLLMEHLGSSEPLNSVASSDRKFPPEFSAN
jgi:uncharacterized protein